MREWASAAVPIILICAAQMIVWAAHPDVQNGGSARVLHNLLRHSAWRSL